MDKSPTGLSKMDGKREQVDVVDEENVEYTIETEDFDIYAAESCDQIFPNDRDAVDVMNEGGGTVLSAIEGCKHAFVQKDIANEIQVICLHEEGDHTHLIVKSGYIADGCNELKSMNMEKKNLKHVSVDRSFADNAELPFNNCGSTVNDWQTEIGCSNNDANEATLTRQNNDKRETEKNDLDAEKGCEQAIEDNGKTVDVINEDGAIILSSVVSCKHVFMQKDIANVIQVVCLHEEGDYGHFIVEAGLTVDICSKLKSTNREKENLKHVPVDKTLEDNAQELQLDDYKSSRTSTEKNCQTENRWSNHEANKVIPACQNKDKSCTENVKAEILTKDGTDESSNSYPIGVVSKENEIEVKMEGSCPVGAPKNNSDCIPNAVKCDTYAMSYGNEVKNHLNNEVNLDETKECKAEDTFATINTESDCDNSVAVLHGPFDSDVATVRDAKCEYPSILRLEDEDVFLLNSDSGGSKQPSRMMRLRKWWKNKKQCFSDTFSCLCICPKRSRKK